MAPSWLPKSIKNQSKIDVKIDQKIEASWNPFLKGFWRILGSKMEPSWYQNGIPNRSYIESAENQTKNGISLIWGGEAGTQNRSKIDIKKDAETDKVREAILIDFASIWEPSWPSKTEPRRSKIDAGMP